ncbi:holo-ACP synthase [Homoserinimonas sp. OAct 916]|uniref:holo-ACP synthase n=1 Tax=Homoserinimonas sp. OAct 916 TaxID=2211450 RepID=UPI000DBE74C9|nr:holo-ACP synthase [Homoserinimonas sp. OAct 916]
MIVGVGVDLVDIARFERAVRRTPALIPRLFAPGERELPAHSLAARFAAKEALVKAVGHSTGFGWQDMEVVSDAEGNPSFRIGGGLATLADRLGIRSFHLSMTHDAGVACAFVVAERSAA